MAGIRFGLGFDLHRRSGARRLYLGGELFDGEPGLEGHSDGDVICHALADALLGAAGLGNLGTHFPDTDPETAGVGGLDLLGRRCGHAGRARSRAGPLRPDRRRRAAPDRAAPRRHPPEPVGNARSAGGSRVGQGNASRGSRTDGGRRRVPGARRGPAVRRLRRDPRRRPARAGRRPSAAAGRRSRRFAPERPAVCWLPRARATPRACVSSAKPLPTRGSRSRWFPGRGWTSSAWETTGVAALVRSRPGGDLDERSMAGSVRTRRRGRRPRRRDRPAEPGRGGARGRSGRCGDAGDAPAPRGPTLGIGRARLVGRSAPSAGGARRQHHARDRAPQRPWVPRRGPGPGRDDRHPRRAAAPAAGRDRDRIGGSGALASGAGGVRRTGGDPAPGAHGVAQRGGRAGGRALRLRMRPR